jgi:ssDNA-binding replication factor A large subunit
MQNYDSLLERISKSSGLTKEEIERRIEAKRAKLSGLISKEGAAQIIAAELGINFDNVQLKISELMPGMKKANTLGKITNIFPVREYNKNNKKGKVANMIIADETGNVRVVLWDTNHIRLIEEKTIGNGDVIEITNAAMRDTEIHLSGFSDLKKSTLILENVKTEIASLEKEIKDLLQGQNVKLRGIVVQLFNPRFFNVCPQCGKKAVETPDGFSCAEHGKVSPQERALLNFVLDDGTETTRAVLFSEQINKLIPEEDLKNLEKLSAFRDDFLGEEIYLSGSVRKNALFNNLEINVNNVEKVNVEKLIEELEKKQ